MFNRVMAQDVSASYASIGIVRVTVAAAGQAAPLSVAPTETAPARRDSVSLSPGALAAAQGFDASAIAAAPASPAPAAGDGAADPTAAPWPPRPSPPDGSRADRLAAVLLKALDANQDGELSQDEFVDGAKALLGRDRARRRGGDDDATGTEAVSRSARGHHVGRGHRLERRLEKAFGRIDADDNGSLDARELAAVLARVSDTSGLPTTEPGPNAAAPVKADASPAPVGTVPPTIDPTTPDQQTTATAPTGAPSTSSGSLFSFSVATVTFVSVAVQKYQAVTGLQG